MNPLKIIPSILCLTLININSYAISKEKIDAYSKEFMKNNNIPGMSIAYIQDDKISVYNYGYANEQKNIPTTENTIYRINSITKTVTATLAGVAQAEGKIKLDIPFVTYFPQVTENQYISDITTAQLLAHVGSMPGIFEEAYAKDPATFSDLVFMLKQYKPTVPVGTQYSYSNYSIAIAGYVLENVYKKSYENLLLEKIVLPLNLESTYLNIPKNLEKQEALGHDEKNNVIPVRKKFSALYAAGEIKSNIKDMAKYLSAQINPEHINDKNLREGIDLVHNTKFCFELSALCQQLAWQEHSLEDLDKQTSDTAGHFRVSEHGQDPFLNKDSFVDKTGGGGGMSSYMAYIKKERKGVVILINKNLGDEKVKLGREILKSL